MVKKNVEVVEVVECAIYKLKELERGVYSGEVIIKGVRIGNEYLAQDEDGNGSHNISIDIDFEINQKEESRKGV